MWYVIILNRDGSQTIESGWNDRADAVYYWMWAEYHSGEVAWVAWMD